MQGLRQLALGTLLIFCAGMAKPQRASEPRAVIPARNPAIQYLALVIANADYANQNPLSNPLNDGHDMAAELKGLGFQVDQVYDADKKKMQDAVREFVRKIHPGDVAWFYYSGHGAQIQPGENYLIPVDYAGRDAISLGDDSYSVLRLQSLMEKAGARVRLIVLDACNSNPYVDEKGAAGLASMATSEGTMIVLGASPGKPAFENKGARNSVFTSALLEVIRKRDRGATLASIMTAAQQLTHQQSNKQQTPWISSSVIDTIPVDASVPVISDTTQPSAPRDECSLQNDMSLWNTITSSREQGPNLYRQYLRICPRGVFAANAEKILARLEAVDPSEANVILNIGGSNTIGAELGPAFAENFLRQLGATRIAVIRLVPEETEVVGDLKGRQVIIKIASHGSATGFICLAAGTCDIAFSSRPVEASDIKGAISGEGDMTGSQNQRVIGADGIIAVVNKKNVIASLTLAQLTDILTGRIRYWEDIPGYVRPPESTQRRHEIAIYVRDDNSGTFALVKSLVLDGAALSAAAIRMEDSRQLSEIVANDPDGIGLVGLAFEGRARKVPVSVHGGQPILPTNLSIASRRYGLWRNLFAYTKSNPGNPYVAQFLDFMQNRQDLVDAVGFVGLNTRPCQTGECGDDGALASLVGGAERQSTVFQFRFGKSNFEIRGLDSRGPADVQRLRAIAAEAERTGDEILLVGFTDDVGTDEYNLRLSRERARFVANLIGAHFANIRVEGFGKEHPVSSNDTEPGRSDNRRVEVFIRRRLNGVKTL